MSETVMETWSSIDRSRSRSVLEPLQRLEYLRFARHRGVALFLFFLDDFFRRVGDEFLVAELGVDPLDVGLGFFQFLVEPRLLCRKIDHALQRQGRHLACLLYTSPS